MGALKGSVWAAINNFTWMPINIHRLIANIVFGGTIAAAYAAFRFLSATTDEERARYDWMGYIGNFVALAAIPLFALLLLVLVQHAVRSLLS